MFFNNFRFIVRRLSRQRLYSALHILGLSIGLSVCIMIGLFIRYELSFDGYHEKSDRIYRINQVWEENGEREVDYGAPAPLANAVREEFSQLENVSVVYPQGERIIEINTTRRFKQDHILLADAEILDIFDFNVLEGNGHEALRNPYQALLTRTTASKFYGRENPIGKTFKYKGEYDITVVGIIEDLPANTHLPASMIISYFPQSRFILRNQDNWALTFGASTFVVLKEGVDPTSLHAPLRAMYDRHVNDDSDDPAIAYAELQPLSKVHLDPTVEGGAKWVKAISPIWLWFFGGIGAVVLLLACINFINLSTAKALTRAREVGVRKVIGASRFQLLHQFIGEALLLMLISGVLASTITITSLPFLNNLIGKNIEFGASFSPGLIIVLISFFIITGLLTGLYPAWFITRFLPAEAVKKSMGSKEKRTRHLRKGLVVFQFTISGVLLVALLIMSQQMKYFHQKSLGFDKDNVITVKMPNNDNNHLFQREVMDLPQVKNVSFAMSAPVSEDTWTTVMHETNLNDPGREEVRLIWADENYNDLYDLKLKAGRFIENRDTSAVSSSIPEGGQVPRVMVNEKLVKVMGYGSPEEALNKKFHIGYNNWKAEVVGVIADFNISSFHDDIEPLLISPLERYHNVASIKIGPGSDMSGTLSAIQSSWKSKFPEDIYDFKFLDQTIANYYESEARLYGLFKIFALLAMLISCFGLWGLASFSAIQRKKEMGIRKVLGASTNGIIYLMSVDFLIPVFLALTIAAPIAWYGMNLWLQNFAFRIDIHWSVFVAAGLLAILIAFMTVSFQSLKVARSNPVESITTE